MAIEETTLGYWLEDAACTECVDLKAENAELRAIVDAMRRIGFLRSDTTSQQVYEHMMQIAQGQGEREKRMEAEIADLRERLSGKTMAYPAGYEEAMRVVEEARRFSQRLYRCHEVQHPNFAAGKEWDALDATISDFDKVIDGATAEAAGREEGQGGS